MRRIDAHTHLFYDRDFLVPLLKDRDMQAVVINITGQYFFDAPMEERWQAMVALKTQYPDRFILCTTFDAMTFEEPGFADGVIRQIAMERQQGAELVKVWKDVGLRIRGQDGHYVQVNDPRFQPIWDYLAAEGVPVMAHIAEPRAAWLPLNPQSPHYTYYRSHPEDHLYRRPTVPSWESLIEGRDQWLATNPDLTVIGCHFGSMAHDVNEVAIRLDRYPNFYIDTSARFGDLVGQPTPIVRDLFLTYRHRILYGTDIIMATPAEDLTTGAAQEEEGRYTTMLNQHEAYLSSKRQIAMDDKLLNPEPVAGLNLPPDVLADIYGGNLRRLLHR